MSLRLAAGHLGELHDHLVRAYPEEGCGILLGREDGDVRVVERLVTLGNHSEEARERRYLIAPEDLLAAERAGREAGLEVIGFFHSHPDHPPGPSAFDLEHAWPYYVYVIVSVERGRVAGTRAWRLAADRGRFEPESIETPSDDGGRSSSPAKAPPP